MHIHKPKPVHNFREFLSELGVVVLGIAIALSGEQLIEALHDKHKAGEAREGIHDEISMNIAVLESRSAAQPCIDRRIDEIATLLEASEGSEYVGPTWLGRPQIWEMLHARWQVVSQSGRAPLLAPEEQAEYGFVYALFADVAADEDREQIAWARLRASEGLPNLSATMRDELRLALQEARLTNWVYQKPEPSVTHQGNRDVACEAAGAARAGKNRHLHESESFVVIPTGDDSEVVAFDGVNESMRVVDTSRPKS